MDLISRQAAIEALGEMPEVWEEDDDEGRGEQNQWYMDKIAIEALPTAEPKWIPCSERLPEEGDNVLWCTRGGYVCSGTILCGVATDDCGHRGNYIAWMPLPKPYEEKNDDGLV